MVRKAVVLSIISIMVLTLASAQAGVSFAGRVVSYDSGTGYSTGYTNSEAALGQMTRITGVYDGVTYSTTPFNMPYGADDLVSVGAGGHLTLELQNYLLPGDGLELGVFSYQMFYQDGWPDGGTTDPVALFRPSQSAVVEVSEDGSTWYALNGGSSIEMNLPGTGYADVAGTIESDFGKSFAGSLTDFDGLASMQDVLDVFGGSAGGNWLDVSASGLDRIGFVRFSVLEGNAFDLEGITLASSAIGAPIPEPVSLILLGVGSLFIRRKV